MLFKNNVKYMINDVLLYSPDERRLSPLGSRGNETILNSPVNRCLYLLLQTPGIIINQDVLFREVWEKQGQFVTMNTLYQNILLVRKGLRNAGVIKSPIKTIPKVGVVFTGKVQVLVDDAFAKEEANTSGVVLPESVETEKPQLKEGFLAHEAPLSADNDVASKMKMQSFVNFLKGKRAVTFIYPTILAATILILLFNIPTRSIVFFNTHDKIAMLNQCSVYIDRGDLKKKSAGYINFLKARNVECGPEEFLYITQTSAKDNILMMFCDTHTEGDLRCSTRFNMSTAALQPRS